MNVNHCAARLKDVLTEDSRAGTTVMSSAKVGIIKFLLLQSTGNYCRWPARQCIICLMNVYMFHC